MARPYTGKIWTTIVDRKQKNGDVYVFEEQRQYDRKKKQTITIKSALKGVKRKGTDKVVFTRPRRKFINITKKETSPLGDVQIIRKHVGMMDIIDHLAETSGVDEDLRAITDLPTANKILSLARYIVVTESHSLAGIEEWQYMHRLPYEDGISKDIYHDLFEEVGRDESLQQAFFRARLDREGKVGLYLACDSSTSSTYSNLLTSGIARYGCNKDGDGLPTVKYLVLFSLATNMPVWFTKLPGNIPDVITVKPVLDGLKALGVKKVTLVSDNGYYSEANLGEMIGQGYDFITLGSIDVTWVKAELYKVCKTIQNPAYVCPFDVDIQGLTVPITHTFEWTRTYASKAKNLKAGDKDTVEKKVWLHFFFNPLRKVNEDRAIKESLLEAKEQLESGVCLDSMSKTVRKLATDCCDITPGKGGKVVVTFRDGALEEVCKYHGFFVLITNRKMDCFDALKWYRRRESIEDFFRRAKQDALMRHTADCDADTLQGRMFTQFVALCLYQHTENEIFAVKDTLLENIDHNGKKKNKTTMDEEKKLWNWLDQRSIVRILNWFDAYDQRDMSTKLKNKRWSDSEAMRDYMFLEKLGIVLNTKK